PIHSSRHTFFTHAPAPPYLYTLSLHDALPISTLVRFLYGLPFAALWLLAVSFWHGFVLPRPNAVFLFWAVIGAFAQIAATAFLLDRKSTRLNSSHDQISYAVFCLKKKTKAYIS